MKRESPEFTATNPIHHVTANRLTNRFAYRVDFMNADDSSSLRKHDNVRIHQWPEMMTETATQVEEKEELDAEQISNKLHFRIQPVQ